METDSIRRGLMISLALILQHCAPDRASSDLQKTIDADGGQPRPEPPEGVQIIPDQGNAHIPYGTPIDQSGFPAYNSNPPTSGPHWPRSLGRGLYATTQPDEVLVHSLEHGYVIVHYNCNDTECPGVAGQLSRLLDQYSAAKVIVHYRPQTAARIALTAWTRLLTLDAPDDPRIVEFIDAFINRLGPEPNAP